MTTPLWFVIPIALFLGLGFVGIFLHSLWSGQFDDLETPAHRILKEDTKIRKDQL